MKKVIFAVTLLMYCLFVTITTHAQGIDVPQSVKQSFMNNFKNSEYERWVKIKDAYAATFSENGIWRDAYFTEDGEYKGIGKYITADLLPIFVKRTLGEQYPDLEITELYQYECMENGLCFYAVLKNDKREVVVQLSPYGDVTYSRKSKIKGAKPVGSDIAINKAH